MMSDPRLSKDVVPPKGNSFDSYIFESSSSNVSLADFEDRPKNKTEQTLINPLTKSHFTED